MLEIWHAHLNIEIDKTAFSDWLVHYRISDRPRMSVTYVILYNKFFSNYF